MMAALFVQAIGKFLLGAGAVAMLLFLPAGTFAYWNAWLLLAILFIPMFLVGLVLLRKNPGLLRKRLNGKEKLAEQGLVIKLSGVMFILGFVLAGLSFRYGWLTLPGPAVAAGTALFLLSYLFYGEVLRENTYLSRTVEVQEGQKVIDTGLYGIVRHPMYSATLVLFLSIPFVLGSLLSFVVFLAYPFLIVKRIRSEEAVLEAELPGYTAYKKKVKYRLLPFIW